MLFEKCTRGPHFGGRQAAPIQEPPTEPEPKKTHFFRPRALALKQVVAGWQWVNCYEEMTPAGKQLLRINLDETSVRTYSSPKPGLVSLSPKRNDARPDRLALTSTQLVCTNRERV